MPILRNAKKALRQNLRRAKRNQVMGDEIQSLRRRLRVAFEKNNLSEARVLVLTLQKKLDKALKKNIFHANTISRLKSKMSRQLNSLAKK